MTDLDEWIYTNFLTVMPILLLLIVLCLIFRIGLGIYIRVKDRRLAAQERYEEMCVRSTSQQLRQLAGLNAMYKVKMAYVDPVYGVSAHFNNLDKYRRRAFDDIFIEHLEELEFLYQDVQHNQAAWKEYRIALGRLKSSATKAVAESVGMDTDTYFEIERELFHEEQLEEPPDSFLVCVTKHYRSPKGRKVEILQERYDMEMIPLMRRKVENEESYKQSEAYRKKKARSEMTDKLRYHVLKRDGFRCKLCGRGADDGVKLHVDHIQPVAKGGKTVMENLQTLCEDCNWGKSDEWEWNKV